MPEFIREHPYHEAREAHRRARLTRANEDAARDRAAREDSDYRRSRSAREAMAAATREHYATPKAERGRIEDRLGARLAEGGHGGMAYEMAAKGKADEDAVFGQVLDLGARGQGDMALSLAQKNGLPLHPSMQAALKNRYTASRMKDGLAHIQAIYGKDRRGAQRATRMLVAELRGSLEAMPSDTGEHGVDMTKMAGGGAPGGGSAPAGGGDMLSFYENLPVPAAVGTRRQLKTFESGGRMYVWDGYDPATVQPMTHGGTHLAGQSNSGAGGPYLAAQRIHEIASDLAQVPDGFGGTTLDRGIYEREKARLMSEAQMGRGATAPPTAPAPRSAMEAMRSAPLALPPNAGALPTQPAAEPTPALDLTPWGTFNIPDGNSGPVFQFEGLGTAETPTPRSPGEREDDIPMFRNQQEFSQWYQGGGRGKYRWKDDRQTHFAR